MQYHIYKFTQNIPTYNKDLRPQPGHADSKHTIKPLKMIAKSTLTFKNATRSMWNIV